MKHMIFKPIEVVLILTILLFQNFESIAVVTNTKATGGTNISADKAANAFLPAYTTLGNIVLTEGSVTDFSAGSGLTFTLNCPSGWTFNPSGSVLASASPGSDISSAIVQSVSSTLITIQLTVSGITQSDVLTISGIEIRANDGGNIPGSANLVRGGAAIISGCSSGTVLGNLSQAAGAINKLVITLPGQTFSDANTAATSGNAGAANTQTAGVNFTLTKIRACDQFYNVVTSYSGVKALNYNGPSNGLTSPVYTTNVSFASGVSSTLLTTNLKKAETTTISVTDGTNSGQASSAITINPGVISNFLVESASGGNISSQITGISFNIKITARDANNNHCTSGPNIFSGTATVTSSGTLTSGGGTTASFSGGILSSHNISISNQGNFTVTAIKTAGSETGSSNQFAVNYPPASLTGISPACIDPGSPAFTITVLGNNFTGTSVVRFNGSDRNTTYISLNQLTADILTSDISTPGIFSITVHTPGTGTTAPLILNMNTSSTANVSICQGSSYILPDGVFENTSGTFISVIPNTEGCDSTIITNLFVTTNPLRTENISICPGTSYTLPDGTIQNSPGTYFSVVPYPQGCDSIITTNLSVYQSPSLNATPVQIDCFGNSGSVLLNTGNGMPPYSYGPEATTNLAPGTYNYYVTDANGCIDSTSVTINPEPSQLSLTATTTQIMCSGGTGLVTLSPSGGTFPYTLGNTPISNLTPGSYNYLLTDNNGCTANATATINSAPSVLAATTSATNTPCGSSIGTATVTATGGTGPYTYSWNTNPVSTARIINGLPSGNYSVIVTDNNGCTVSKTVTISNTNSTPVNITGVTGICPGGTTTLCATAGFASYSWSSGETTSCITVSTADTFFVTVTDMQGCSNVKSVITNNSSLPTCTITGGVLCPNSTLILRAPLGYSSYLWTNGVKTSYNTIRTPGTFSVTIKNAAGCTSNCSYTVNSTLKVTVSKIDGKCSNEYKGSATATANGGVPPYSYLWSNGATTASVNGLAAGSYTVRVTDAGGCLVSFTTVINSNITTNDYSTVAANFNNNQITPGSTIWFSAVVNINFTGNYPVTIRFRNQNISSSAFNLSPLNAKLIITNAVSQAYTAFNGSEWVTTAPPNLAGNYFVSGYAFPVVSPIAANLSSVKWKGVWLSSSSCVTNVHWKWSAATYSNFATNYSLVDIKPVDDNTASPYINSDFAGTPDNFKSNCIAGARCIGGNDYVGTYTAIGNRLPCSTPDVCTSPRLSGTGIRQEEGSNFKLNVYPNPFTSQTKIEFENSGKACHLSIDIYTYFGQKVKTIFENDIEADVKYTAEFDASELADGIYIYRFVSDEEQVSGKLFLQR